MCTLNETRTELSEFIRDTLRKESKKIIEDSTIIKLSKDEFTQFMDVLETPPKANKSLENAMQEYKEGLDDGNQDYFSI